MCCLYWRRPWRCCRQEEPSRAGTAEGDSVVFRSVHCILPLLVPRSIPLLRPLPSAALLPYRNRLDLLQIHHPTRHLSQSACILPRGSFSSPSPPPPPPPPHLQNFTNKNFVHIVRLLWKLTYGLIRLRQTYLVLIINLVKSLVTL